MAVEQRSREVDSALAGRDYAKAISLALHDPPIGGSQQEKDLNFQTVMRALSAPSDREIPDIAAQVSQNSELADNLMKYIYRGLSVEQSNGPLFKWHSEVVKACGNGCVVRALTDRKAV